MECPFCNANESTQFTRIGAYDNPQGKPKPYAYMIYQCECDAICKKNIWSHDTELWIDPTNQFLNIKGTKQ